MLHKVRVADVINLLDLYRTKDSLFRDRLDLNKIICFSNKLKIEPYTSIKGNNLCTMGSFSYSQSPVLPELIVGRYSSIAIGLQFFGPAHPVQNVSLSPFTYLPKKKSIMLQPYIDKNILFNNNVYNGDGGANGIVIGNDCWIGQNVTIKFGCKIGDGAIVAANSLVTKDVPPYAVVGGIPAKVIKYRFNDDLIEKFKELKWWEYDVTDLNGLPFEDPNKFIEEVQLRVKSLKKYNPRCLTCKDILQENYKNKKNLKIAEDVRENVTFNYHFSNYGWFNDCANDCVIDLDSQLEAIKVKVNNDFIVINYAVMIENSWYEEISTNLNFLGTTGKFKPISAIKIKSDYRKIFYRIKDENQGWSKVYYNGHPAISSSGKIIGIHIAVS